MKTIKKIWLITLLLHFGAGAFAQNSLHFDGINDYISWGNTTQFNQGPYASNPYVAPLVNTSFTIELWIKTGGVHPISTTNSILFAFNSHTRGSNRLLFGIDLDGALFTHEQSNNIGGSSQRFNGVTNLYDGECHHIAFSYNFVLNTYSVLIDGNLENNTISGSTTTTANFVLSNTDIFSFGHEWDNLTNNALGVAETNGPSQFYYGSMRDIRIWTNARTAAQIQTNMNTIFNNTTPNLHAYYYANQGVASGNNTLNPILTNGSLNGGGVFDGSLTNFALIGQSSNFVANTCCLGAVAENFTTVVTNININTFWDGKIFIPDNTIITVDNAFLDITTADVVFGQCSGIDFVNGAELHANNTVFRPCNVNDTWRGLRFFGPSVILNQLNENTFKNAEIAILLEGNGVDGLISAEINANTFVNCNEGVYVRNARYTETIFGNNFVTNNNFPIYSNCYSYTNPTNVNNIHIISNNIADQRINQISILHNSIVNTRQSNDINVTGIEIVNGASVISENKMTNLTDAIILTTPQAMSSIENNELELTNIYSTNTSSTSQITVNRALGPIVTISNNSLAYSNGDELNTRTAIDVQRSRNVSVFHNFIDGFELGINTRLSQQLNISENIMTNISDFGIYAHLYENTQNFITCNDITMEVAQGAGIRTLGMTQPSVISSNCVKDANVALRLNGTNNNMPLIRNNFFYNFQVGIWNVGLNGDIGTNTNPGMNTLWSNQNNLTDISSNTAISIAGNYGVFTYTPTVMVTNGSIKHSTASCATQIVDYDNQGNFNPNYACRNDMAPIEVFESIDGNYQLPQVGEFISYAAEFTNPKDVILSAISMEGMTENYLVEVLDYFEYNEEDRNEIWYEYSKYYDSYSVALSKLELIPNHSLIELVSLKFTKGEFLSEQDVLIVGEYLENDNVSISDYNLAVSISKSTELAANYKFDFPVYEAPVIDHSKIIRIVKDEVLLSAFPNPAQNNITVEILDGTANMNQRIMIYDIYGKVIQEQNLSFTSGRAELNIETLSAGTYFISLHSEGEMTGNLKFIKM